MKNEYRFNVNNSILVKLNERGIKLVEEYYDAPPEINEDGYCKFQMTIFMDIFGNHVYPTMSPPFYPEIKLCKFTVEMELEDG